MVSRRDRRSKCRQALSASTLNTSEALDESCARAPHRSSNSQGGLYNGVEPQVVQVDAWDKRTPEALQNPGNVWNKAAEKNPPGLGLPHQAACDDSLHTKMRRVCSAWLDRKASSEPVVNSLFQNM